MRNKIGIVLIVAAFISCKKTKLKGDFAPLVGNWEWQYTVKYDDGCNIFNYDSLITHSPSIDGFTYTLEFKKKGILILKKNGKKEECYRLVLQEKEMSGIYKNYGCKLNNKDNHQVRFRVYNGRMLTEYFPEGVLDGPDGCQSITSVFTKTN